MPTNSYRQESTTATKWRRGSGVRVYNPLNAAPSIHFTEEDVVQIGTSTVISEAPNDGMMVRAFSPTGEIPMRNPETGELTGSTVSHQMLYAILYSLYMETALARDAA